jgi:sugar phosphate isomerase/epimerase
VAATADLYAFMHCDDYLFGGPVNYSPGTRPSVAELLAKFYRLPPHLQDKRISDLANRLAAVAKNVPVAINAMATHMPQLYSVNKNRANEAFDAFCFLARLREKLPKGHDIRTIEISAGSLVKGILPRRTEANEPAIKLLAWRRSRPDAYRLLIKRITRLCHRIDASCRDTNFSLALELEPGPLFVLHDMDSLVDVAQRIENSTSAALKRRVGFNIDIAHCILAGIDPDALFANNSIADRICHFHISDHGIGHFGDAPLGDCGFGRWSLTPDDRLALLRPWIRHAVQYAQKRPTDGSGDAPRFSGLISLELEAAQSPEMVERSASILDQLLTEAGNDDGLRSNKNTLAKLISWIPLPRRAHR